MFKSHDMFPNASSASTNAPTTCVVSVPKNRVKYTPMAPVFCFEVPRIGVTNYCHYEGLEEWLKNASKSVVLDGDLESRSAKSCRSEHLHGVVHQFMLRYTFIGVTVGVTSRAGSRELALDVGNHVKVRNLWGSAAEASRQLGLRLSWVARGDGMEDLTLRWATRRHDGQSNSTDKQHNCIVSWFLPLFVCLTTQTGLVTATLKHASFDLDKY